MGRPICTKPLVLTVVAISLIYSNISSTSYVLLTTNTTPPNQNTMMNNRIVIFPRELHLIEERKAYTQKIEI